MILFYRCVRELGDIQSELEAVVKNECGRGLVSEVWAIDCSEERQGVETFMLFPN